MSERWPMSLSWGTPAALTEARDAAACCPSGGEADGRSATGFVNAAAAGVAEDEDEDGPRTASSAGGELSARTTCGAGAVAAVAAAGAGSSFTSPSICTKNAMIPTIAPTQTKPTAGHFHHCSPIRGAVVLAGPTGLARCCRLVADNSPSRMAASWTCRGRTVSACSVWARCKADRASVLNICGMPPARSVSRLTAAREGAPSALRNEAIAP